MDMVKQTGQTAGDNAEQVLALLRQTVAAGASDLMILSGMPLTLKVKGKLSPLPGERVMPDAANRMVKTLYQLADRGIDQFLATGDDDFPLSVPGLSRFRVSAYRQRGSMAAVIRVVLFDIPDPEKLGIPREVMDIADKSRGLALITGSTGCGKSTTLACIIDRINRQYDKHIITLEDPIEFMYRNKRSAISQREIGSDTANYLTAMRACMRQSPDVIQLGEMRDSETITTAVTAAETGHLVLSTLHTMGAVSTIDRIIDSFPANAQQQIRMQLSLTLQTVVSQQLLPTLSGGQVPAFEIMQLNSAIRNMIRESKTHQIDGAIATASSEGMLSMDVSVLNLYRQGMISRETAIKHAMNAEQMARKLN